MSDTVFSFDVSKDAAIRRALVALENDFFPALQGNTSTLVDFAKSWAAFAVEVESCAHELQDDTLSMIYSLAQTGVAVVPALLELDEAGDDIHRQLQDDIAKLTLEDTSHARQNSISLEPSSYIEPSYSWLLDNLHNPYPSTRIRASISRQTSSLRKDVDAWFVDVRKRIGWNQIRRQHFTKRHDMINSATRFFRPSSSLPDSKCDADAGLEMEFITMENRARNLYSKKFPDVDSTSHRALLHAHEQRSACVKSARESCYPSPLSSPCTSPEPLSRSPSPHPVPSCTRKRSLSVSSGHGRDVTLSPLPRKRVRVNSSTLSPDFIGLPSPAASLPDTPCDNSSPPRQSPSLPRVTLLSSSLPASRKRKRLSSTTELPPSNKRQCRTQTTQTTLQISDTARETPFEFTLEDWLRGTLNSDVQLRATVPGPVAVDGLSPSSPVHVSFCDALFGFAPVAPKANTETLSTDRNSCTSVYSPVIPSSVVADCVDPFNTINLTSILTDPLSISDNPSFTGQETYEFDLSAWPVDVPSFTHVEDSFAASYDLTRHPRGYDISNYHVACWAPSISCSADSRTSTDSWSSLFASLNASVPLAI